MWTQRQEISGVFSRNFSSMSGPAPHRGWGTGKEERCRKILISPYLREISLAASRPRARL
jgi:hypothetical protein